MNAGGIVLPHHSNIRVERDEHVATVTIDRIEAKNACTGDMWVAIGAAFRELAYSGARVVILTGAGERLLRGRRPDAGPRQRARGRPCARALRAR